MSKLLTDKQLQTIPNLYETENQKDPICHINPDYAIEKVHS